MKKELVRTMQLCLDLGNSRMKWGIWAPKPLSQWLLDGEISYAALSTPTLGLNWQHLLPQIHSIWVTSVTTPDRYEMVRNFTQGLVPNAPWHRIETRSEFGKLKNGYENPSQLGSDRWCALVAAVSEFPKNSLLVINCGTALTIDVVNTRGKHLGGWIVPGLYTQQISLFEQTAQLRSRAEQTRPHEKALLKKPQHLVKPALNTHDAIEKGSLLALASMIESIVVNLNLPKQKIILSGGEAAWIALFLTTPHVLREYLVLDGLIEMARQSLTELHL